MTFQVEYISYAFAMAVYYIRYDKSGNIILKKIKVYFIMQHFNTLLMVQSSMPFIEFNINNYYIYEMLHLKYILYFAGCLV